jgi:hypothetical protein
MRQVVFENITEHGGRNFAAATGSVAVLREADGHGLIYQAMSVRK